MSETAADKLRRVLQLIPELADDKDHAVDEIATGLGIDRQTLLGDLRSLAQRFDDPGGFVEGVQIYLGERTVSLRSDHFLRPMRLTIGEVGTLELGLALLRSESAPEEYRGLEQARERLQRVLAKLPGDPTYEGVREASTGTESDASTLALVRRSVRNRRKLALTYRGSRSDEGLLRIVCPYAPVFASGAWYLVAHCQRSEAIRIFRLDRIEAAEPVDERFEIPADFSLEGIVRGGKVFQGSAEEVVTIRYSPAIARWIAEREGKALAPDGSLTLEHPLADPHWVVRHVLQYGAEAEVLSPESARNAVRTALDRILAAS
ncbi:MAG: WYL domain-containing protein [Gemmatimonadota bacterium]